MAIVNYVTINTGMKVSLKYIIISSFGSVLQSGITRSYAISIFSFFEKSPYEFHSSCTSLRSYQQWRRDPFLFMFSPASTVSIVGICLTNISWLFSIPLLPNCYLPGSFLTLTPWFLSTFPRVCLVESHHLTFILLIYIQTQHYVLIHT